MDVMRQGAGLEVMEPIALRTEVGTLLRAAASRYD
jgi:hypothetical protein